MIDAALQQISLFQIKDNITSFWPEKIAKSLGSYKSFQMEVFWQSPAYFRYKVVYYKKWF